MITFGQRLKELRTLKRLTQQQLADVFYLNKSSISRYENNSQIPENELLQKIADYFEVSVDYLLGRTKEQSPPNNEFKPELNKRDKKDIEKTLNEFKEGSKGTLMLDGEIVDEETETLLWKSIENILEIAKLNNKAKYTPKKFRK